MAKVLRKISTRRVSAGVDNRAYLTFLALILFALLSVTSFRSLPSALGSSVVSNDRLGVDWRPSALDLFRRKREREEISDENTNDKKFLQSLSDMLKEYYVLTNKNILGIHHPRQMIENGFVPALNRFPYTAALLLTSETPSTSASPTSSSSSSSSSDTMYLCVGALISPRVVVTAAHCVSPSVGGVPNPAVLFGATRRKSTAVKMASRSSSGGLAAIESLAAATIGRLFGEGISAITSNNGRGDVGGGGALLRIRGFDGSDATNITFSNISGISNSDGINATSAKNRVMVGDNDGSKSISNDDSSSDNNNNDKSKNNSSKNNNNNNNDNNSISSSASNHVVTMMDNLSTLQFIVPINLRSGNSDNPHDDGTLIPTSALSVSNNSDPSSTISNNDVNNTSNSSNASNNTSNTGKYTNVIANSSVNDRSAVELASVITPSIIHAYDSSSYYSSDYVSGYANDFPNIAATITSTVAAATAAAATAASTSSGGYLPFPSASFEGSGPFLTSRSVVHPKYHPMNFDFDTAVLILSEPVNDIRPITLVDPEPIISQYSSSSTPTATGAHMLPDPNFAASSSASISDPNPSSQSSTGGSRQDTTASYSVLGWGATEANVFSSTLLEADVAPVDPGSCQVLFKPFNSTLTPRMVCVSGRTCAGDSGGPLVLRRGGGDKDTPAQDVLYGHTSFGFPRRLKAGCPSPNPATVFTNLRNPEIHSWLVQMIQENSS